MATTTNGGVKLYYEIHGEGEPLLLIPGFGSTIPVYHANLPALAKHFRVIALDPRGAGRSDSPPGQWTMEMFADDCAAVLDAAGEASAHVFGTSFGGMVAQHFALRHPERLRRLVLGCTSPGGEAHVLPPVEQLELYMRSLGHPDSVDGLRMRYPLHYSDGYIAEHDADIVAQVRSMEYLRSSDADQANQLAAVRGHDTAGRLGEIRAETLVQHGEGDGIVPVANGHFLASHIPNARLTVYPIAKHIYFTELASEVNAEIAAFLTG